ncbi:aminomethyltransferase family protein [bacterium]|nr:aminomethyltransferase family protein [bacterium]
MRSPLYDILKTQGAVFKSYDEFLFELPAHFVSIQQEYRSLKQACVCIDFSYYGSIKLTGKHAQDFLNRMSTNNLKNLNINEFTSTVLTNDKGRIIDLIVVYRLVDGLLITTSPQNHINIIAWLEKYIIMDDVKIENLSSKIIQLGLIGPRSADVLITMTAMDPPKQNHVVQFLIAGNSIYVARSHQLDEGFLLVTDISGIDALWNLFVAQDIGVCGMDAYLAARIEQRKPIFRRELTDKYNPLEAGLAQAVSFNKGCYIGQEVIARLDSYNKIQKHLVLLKSEEPVSLGSKITAGNQEIGIVTSSSYSYSNKQNLALGYVKTEFTSGTASFTIFTDGKLIHAEICP